jgi:hypothetical protein
VAGLLLLQKSDACFLDLEEVFAKISPVVLGYNSVMDNIPFFTEF